MGTYFDFTVERKHDGKWQCVAESDYSDYEDDMMIINPYVLKGAFDDTSYYKSIGILNEDELSLESWRKFTEKSSVDYADYDFDLIHVDLNCDVGSMLDILSYGKFKNHDLCLWFDKDHLWEKRKQYASSVFYFKSDDLNELLEMKNKVENAKNKEEFFMLAESTNNVLFRDDLIGIAINHTPYEISQSIKYSPIYKGLEIKTVDVVQYIVPNSSPKKYVKPYNLFGNVSYKNDIESLISEIGNNIERYKNSMKANEIAKSYISDILSEYEDNDKENATELYSKLKEFCGESDFCADYDYLEDLTMQKKELEFLLRFVGEGRLIWYVG